MLIFGLGEVSKLIMIVMIIVFQIVITSRDAVKAIPAETFRSLRSLGASRWQKLSEVIIPASLPEVLTATRVALERQYPYSSSRRPSERKGAWDISSWTHG